MVMYKGKSCQITATVRAICLPFGSMPRSFKSSLSLIFRPLKLTTLLLWIRISAGILFLKHQDKKLTVITNNFVLGLAETNPCWLQNSRDSISTSTNETTHICKTFFTYGTMINNGYFKIVLAFSMILSFWLFLLTQLKESIFF